MASSRQLRRRFVDDDAASIARLEELVKKNWRLLAGWRVFPSGRARTTGFACTQAPFQMKYWGTTSSSSSGKGLIRY